MTNYENAPATKMLATRCAACSRPLVDAVSVETGMGPDCRKTYGYNTDVSPEARAEANKIVYNIALDQQGFAVAQGAERLKALGFGQLAQRILERVCTVVVLAATADSDHNRYITKGSTYLRVKTPYTEASVVAFRAIPGRYFRKAEKVNAIPQSQRKQLWNLLNEQFPGQLGLSDRGVFVIGKPEPTTPWRGENERDAVLAEIEASEARREAHKEAMMASDVDADMAKMEMEADRAGTVRENIFTQIADLNMEAGRCPDGCCGPGGDAEPTEASKVADAKIKILWEQYLASSKTPH